MDTQFLINCLVGIAGFFIVLYIKNQQSAIEELKERNHELTSDITQVRLTYVTKEDLRQMLVDLLAPLSKSVDELKTDIKQKQDKGTT